MNRTGTTHRQGFSRRQQSVSRAQPDAGYGSDRIPYREMQKTGEAAKGKRQRWYTSPLSRAGKTNKSSNTCTLHTSCVNDSTNQMIQPQFLQMQARKDEGSWLMTNKSNLGLTRGFRVFPCGDGPVASLHMSCMCRKRVACAIITPLFYPHLPHHQHHCLL